MDRLEIRLERTVELLFALTERVERLEKKFDERFDEVNKTLTTMAETMAKYTVILSERVTNHEGRITKLEALN